MRLRYRQVLLVSVCAAALLAPASSAGAQAAEAVPGQVIVGFKPSTGSGQRANARAAVDGSVKRRLALPRAQLIQVEGSAAAAARRLERRPDVAYAHPNYIWQMSALPNDPRYGELHAMTRIEAPAAWDLTTGSRDVVVAVLDSGVDMDHPDLRENIWRNPGEAGGGKESDGVDNDGNGKVDDWRGWDFSDSDNDPHDGYIAHGTHVAGTIGAHGNNGVGVTGVNWNVTLMPLRIGRDDGSINMAAAVDAADYAAQNGAKIVNMSFGGGLGQGQPVPEAQRQVMQRHPGVLFVIAAGNETNDNDAQGGARYPCNFSSEPNAICVAATDENDALADYSNFGARNVQLAAPGSSILSTQPLAQVHDGFDTVTPGRWTNWQEPIAGFIPVNNNPWGRTTADKHGGTHSYTDSPGGTYMPAVNSGIRLSTAVSTVYDPADPELPGCFADFWWKPAPGGGLGESGFHTFHLQMMEPAGLTAGMWGNVNSLTAHAFVIPGGWQHVNWTIGPWVFKHRVHLRLAWEAGWGASPGDGVYVDDFRFWCGAAVPHEYKANDGTSMATPHVAGVAALLAARRPNASPGELKQALLGSVERLPALAGKVATGGRLNARRALAYAGAPNTTLTAGPAGETTNTAPTFTFEADDAHARFECSLDQVAFAPCTSPYTPAALGQGAHTFAVRAVDPGGVADPTPAAAAFTVVPVPVPAPEPEPVPEQGQDPPAGPPVLRSLKLKATKGGFRLTYRLSAAAQVRFRVERIVAGRRASVRVPGKLDHRGKAGANRLRFNGKLRGKRLQPGRYRLVGRATDVTGAHSKVATCRFKVKRPRSKRP